ncbi:Trk system potassium uptake protein TrkG [Roseivivax sp. THAF40]|uniref:potassium transporter TrkG n=1 Tax=unclassified Roseivivax TaxID=2639302 RepID=UPI0012684046|nr:MULTISPECIES: potassium transporter TrkG [unclassified Roseivivax]QFS83461.1 Trk system potassium uptake protein TrkG [Roseivivax sp. THAF197b]QFT47206.1 Trk system potassium uptake protein TrkG [Roseivivax sp. THAF40]
MARLLSIPLLILLAGAAALAMLAPAGLALAYGEYHDARSFFHSALLGFLIASLLGIARAGLPNNRNDLRQLFALLLAFILLPAMLAVPFHQAVRTTSFLNAYVEMVSALTTTGATLFAPDRLSMAEHLWRAQVGWMGGLLMWIAAAAILAPLTLGGFEVTAVSEPGQSMAPGAAHRDKADPRFRLARAVHGLVPIYLGLTLALWLLLMVTGDRPFVALCHAMSTMATSGISPIGGLAQAESGIWGEAVVFCFLFFALSRLTFSNDTSAARRQGLMNDPEFRIGLAIVAAVPLILFARHWVASFDVGTEENIVLGLRAFWGAAFTTLSFLTTTGFESADWTQAQGWSGLDTPGLILMGLAIIGGGVATTAGGVKLLRVFILYLNGKRELERLIHPNSVGRSGLLSRRTRREGAFIAWVFFMIFALTIAVMVLAFSIQGIPFEGAFVMTIAALTNTGPLVALATEMPLPLTQYAPSVKATLALAMILGRLEVLAIVVMLSPDLWRD